jgi:predicted MPP superfamily phosphohydrolase
LGDRRVVAPRWICPALALPGQAFDLVVEGRVSADARMRLTRAGDGLSVAVESAEPVTGVDPDAEPFTRLRCRPEAWPTVGQRLFHLEIATGNRRAVAPNSVCLLAGQPAEITLVHTSDLHLLLAQEGRLVERRGVARALVDAINALKPDLVLNTGDLISRYGVDQARLSDAQIRWQARQVRRIFSALEAPMFVVPGNHDLAFNASRAAWAEEMGLPWRRDTDDYCFDLGPARFIALDGRQYCDEITGNKLAPERSEAQKAWLRDALRSSCSSSALRLVFTHYDYAGDIGPILAEEGCDLLLIGHTNAPPEGGAPWIDGHLSGTLALRVWHIGDGRAVPGQELSYAQLGVALPFDEALLSG